VRTDGARPIPGCSRAGSDPGSTRSAGRGRLEVAQRVWQRSLELAGTGRHIHLPDQALALSRAAGYDPDTMTHALALGRSRARHPSNDESTRRGVRLLERAVAYLGVRAVLGEVTGPGPRRAATSPARVALSLVREDHHHAPDDNRRRRPTPAERRPSLLAASWPPEPVPAPEPVPPPEPVPSPEPVPPPEPMRARILRSSGTPVSPRQLPGH
jgi:hypothetical protein